MLKQWKTLFNWLNRYRNSYGGVLNMIRSPFFGVALILTAASYSMWITPTWIEKTESLIPSLLGFSLGTYAILFSIMSSRLKGALRSTTSPSGTNYLEAINATFFHFIFVQVLSLTWAFGYSGTAIADLVYYTKPYYPIVTKLFYYAKLSGSFVGLFLLIYSVLLMIASALAIYRLALIRDPSEGE